MDERRKSQRIAAKMAVDLLLADESGEALAGPVGVELDTFSLHGGSVVLSSMQADGLHFFYACSDREGCCLKLCFVDSSGRRHAISCRPAWFDKEISARPIHYKLGVEFCNAEEHDHIKLLDRIARGKSEKDLFATICDFFK